MPIILLVIIVILSQESAARIAVNRGLNPQLWFSIVGVIEILALTLVLLLPDWRLQ